MLLGRRRLALDLTNETGEATGRGREPVVDIGHHPVGLVVDVALGHEGDEQALGIALGRLAGLVGIEQEDPRAGQRRIELDSAAGPSLELLGAALGDGHGDRGAERVAGGTGRGTRRHRSGSSWRSRSGPCCGSRGRAGQGPRVGAVGPLDRLAADEHGNRRPADGVERLEPGGDGVDHEQGQHRQPKTQDQEHDAEHEALGLVDAAGEVEAERDLGDRGLGPLVGALEDLDVAPDCTGTPPVGRHRDGERHLLLRRDGDALGLAGKGFAVLGDRDAAGPVGRVRDIDLAEPDAPGLARRR